MLKVLDVFRIGNMMSITLEGSCENISNGCRLIDGEGKIIIVESVAMTRHSEPSDIRKNTTILIKPCNIQKGSELSIA